MKVNGDPIIIPLSDPDRPGFHDDGDDADWENDDDIACPLFYRLQEFFVMELDNCSECARENARVFMREYWSRHLNSGGDD